LINLAKKKTPTVYCADMSKIGETELGEAGLIGTEFLLENCRFTEPPGKTVKKLILVHVTDSHGAWLLRKGKTLIDPEGRVLA